MLSPIKVIIVDDHPVALNGMRSYFEDNRSIEVIETALNPKELIESLEKACKPDVIIMDIEMPEMDGIEALILIQKKFPGMKVIIYSMHNEREIIKHCIENGANGYIPKACQIEELEKAIVEVHKTGFYHYEKITPTPIKINTSAIAANNVDNLSPKQIELLELICEGLLNKEIASKLGKSIQTIDYHKKILMDKTGCLNNTQLGVYARKNGFVR